LETFYITTPIYYPNAPPHIGHAYTTVFADVIARYRKFMGEESFLLTGTDEHGLKLQKIAEKMNVDPKEYVDKMADVFKNYWKTLDISYNYFIRTTDDFHVEVVKKCILKLYEKGLIYKDRYSGWYCSDCEKFYSERDYVEIDGKPHCPIHNKPLEWLDEETYFFKLSVFKDYVMDVLENTDVVYPKQYAIEVLNRLREEGLKDVSIARRKDRVWWGIELPFDPDYTVYVWFDALLNYVSGIGYLRDNVNFEKFWRNSYHVIGKDILWFHTVIWFSVLKALDIPLPKRVITHAFLLNKGLKMGKSTGNVITIEELINRYGEADPVRYLLVRVFNMDKDVEVSYDIFDSIYTSELVDNYGNLVRRVGVLAMKKTKGVIYRRTLDKDIEISINNTIKNYVDAMDRFETSEALANVMRLLDKGNSYMNQTKPWERSSPERELYNVLEIIRVATNLLNPVMPSITAQLAKSFGFNIVNYSNLKPVERYEIKDTPILFRKIKLKNV